MQEIPSGLNAQEWDDLRYAKHLLENPGLASKITHILGAPIEKGFEFFPPQWADVVQHATHTSLRKALDMAVAMMARTQYRPSSDLRYKMAVATSGAAGGAFGLLALTIELPISTLLMLRSITDIARSQGETITSSETKLACLEVFAMGGRSREDDAAETGYFAARAALGAAMKEASEYLARVGMVEHGAPALVRFISTVAGRFGLVVSQKAAAQALPFIGASGGALVNTIFLDHFQDMARGHFIVRRLQRTYGEDTIREAYGLA